MKRVSIVSLVSLGLLGSLALIEACGSPPKALPPASPAPKVEAHSNAENADDGTKCPAAIDARALLANHARAFGDEAAYAASLPRTRSGTVLAEGQQGTFELVVDRATKQVTPANRATPFSRLERRTV